MPNLEKSIPAKIAGNLAAIVSGAFLASFVFSFTMNGFWAFVIATAGGVLTSISLRFFKIRMKTLLPGVIIGYLACAAIWAWTYWGLSVNLWLSAVYVLAMGLASSFIPEGWVANWPKKILSKSDVNRF